MNQKNDVNDTSKLDSDLPTNKQLQGKHVLEQKALIKSWLQKLLVAGLCALSFYAGWQARDSNQVKQCLQSGGTLNPDSAIFSCQW